jgi:uncharacterized protein (TIGR03084 family)
MTLLDDLLADLDAETTQLQRVVEDAGDDGWGAVTPAEGWTVATQVAHLVWTDEVATLAATDEERWDAVVLEAIADPEGYVDAAAHELARTPRRDLVHRWRVAGAALRNPLRDHPPGQKMPWFGPPMSPASMATARYMETWAHSRDVHDALGVEQPVTDRIRHVAHLGVRTRGFAFVTHGLEAPTTEVRVVLTAPSGEEWTWDPEDAPDTVTGSALDFCLLVTQRVHRHDTDLVATGDAERWLEIAQAFAGPPGPGRQPEAHGG